MIVQLCTKCVSISLSWSIERAYAIIIPLSIVGHYERCLSILRSPTHLSAIKHHLIGIRHYYLPCGMSTGMLLYTLMHRRAYLTLRSTRYYSILVIPPYSPHLYIHIEPLLYILLRLRTFENKRRRFAPVLGYRKRRREEREIANLCERSLQRL